MKPYLTQSAKNQSKKMGPKPKRDLSTREKIILMESSKLNGSIFPPWTAPNPSDFDMPQYADTRELPLSTLQLDVFDGWRRPTETVRTSSNVPHRTPTMISKKSIDLVQDITTDCSVVASLCAVSARLDSRRSDVFNRLSLRASVSRRLTMS